MGGVVFVGGATTTTDEPGRSTTARRAAPTSSWWLTSRWTWWTWTWTGGRRGGRGRGRGRGRGGRRGGRRAGGCSRFLVEVDRVELGVQPVGVGSLSLEVQMDPVGRPFRVAVHQRGEIEDREIRPSGHRVLDRGVDDLVTRTVVLHVAHGQPVDRRLRGDRRHEVVDGGPVVREVVTAVVVPELDHDHLGIDVFHQTGQMVDPVLVDRGLRRDAPDLAQTDARHARTEVRGVTTRHLVILDVVHLGDDRDERLVGHRVVDEEDFLRDVTFAAGSDHDDQRDGAEDSNQPAHAPFPASAGRPAPAASVRSRVAEVKEECAPIPIGDACTNSSCPRSSGRVVRPLTRLRS